MRVELGQELDPGVRFCDANHSVVMANVAIDDALIEVQRFLARCHQLKFFIRGVVVCFKVEGEDIVVVVVLGYAALSTWPARRRAPLSPWGE